MPESSRRRPPPSSLQLVPVTRIEKRSSNETRRQRGSEMTNRSGGQHFPMTGRPPDRDWMDTKRIRPTWMGNEARDTVDSGIEFTENRYLSLPLQPGGRKIQVICRGMVHIKGYCFSQRTQRVLYQEVRCRKPDRNGPRMTCAHIGGHSTTEAVRDYGY